MDTVRTQLIEILSRAYETTEVGEIADIADQIIQTDAEIHKGGYRAKTYSEIMSRYDITILRDISHLLPIATLAGLTTLNMPRGDTDLLSMYQQVAPHVLDCIFKNPSISKLCTTITYLCGLIDTKLINQQVVMTCIHTLSSGGLRCTTYAKIFQQTEYTQIHDAFPTGMKKLFGSFLSIQSLHIPEIAPLIVQEKIPLSQDVISSLSDTLMMRIFEYPLPLIPNSIVRYALTTPCIYERLSQTFYMEQAIRTGVEADDYTVIFCCIPHHNLRKLVLGHKSTIPITEKLRSYFGNTSDAPIMLLRSLYKQLSDNDFVGYTKLKSNVIRNQNQLSNYVNVQQVIKYINRRIHAVNG